MKNAVFLLFFWWASFILIGCIPEKLPTDKYLIKQLEENKDKYEEAVKIALSMKLSRFEVISNGEIIVRPSTHDSNSLEYMKELLIEKLNVDLINTMSIEEFGDTTNEVAFYNFRRGFVFSGEHKGLVYVIDDSKLYTVEQLDSIDSNSEDIQNRRLYKNISPNWYIFYEYLP